MTETVTASAPKIFALVAQAMARVGVVGKERKNVQQGYAFRGIDDVLAAVQLVFAELGIVPAPRVLEREREEFKTAKGSSMFSVRLLVEHRFYGPDGSFIEVTTLGEAMDTGDKSSNKAMSQAFKYALIEMLAIPTYERERDTEDASPEVMGRAVQPQQRQAQRQPPPQQRSAPPADGRPGPGAPAFPDFNAINGRLHKVRGYGGDANKEARKTWWSKVLGYVNPGPQWSPFTPYGQADAAAKRRVLQLLEQLEATPAPITDPRADGPPPREDDIPF